MSLVSQNQSDVLRKYPEHKTEECVRTEIVARKSPKDKLLFPLFHFNDFVLALAKDLK